MQGETIKKKANRLYRQHIWRDTTYYTSCTHTVVKFQL